jgi:ABC-type multidrug transport system ATPase subunit
LKNAIIAQDVSKSYNGFVVLNSVSFIVGFGEAYVVLGPNGAGKSTLFSIIAGVMKPSYGSVKVLGNVPFNPSTRLKISYLPPNPPLYPWLTVMENIDFYSSLYELDKSVIRQEAMELLERLGIRDLSNKLASKLSTGQSKLASIVLTLVVKPELLILDEPTTGLDPGMRKIVINLLRKYVSNRTTILMATILLMRLRSLQLVSR